ncbi:MAG: glycoside hydrolase family 99-like domain-containing protein, partial [Kiritimatiellae bacterium]|nr:glycoside hydrolase family 99-like domain-containing protein [Kiritimatiellia bacterium]
MPAHPCTKRLAAMAAGALLAASAAAAQYDVAAYVWPAYQPEPRWAELDIFPEGIGEWQNVKEAVPKWKGHVQPLEPLWGYENEADPAVVAKKIDAAVAHGVNVFIYDWYWYGHRPFLESALDDGFLGAPNNGRMRFFIMWANHHVNKLWDNRVADKRWSSPTWRGWVSQEEFKELTWRWIEKYFRRGNYYRIGGRPVLMIYELKTFVDGVGGLANAMESVAYLRDACRAAGLGGVHLMTCDFGVKQEWVRALGVESASIYNFVHWSSPYGNPDYSAWAERGAQRFVHAKAQLGVQCYFAHASVGWDTNPRYPAGSVQPTVLGSSPEKFEVALRRAKDWCDRNTPPGWPHLVTVNSWNEWTEGSYLEPDEQFGYGYLEAVRRVFGPGSPPAAVPGIVTVESLIDETLDREAVTRMPVPAYARSHWGGAAGASGAR